MKESAAETSLLRMRGLPWTATAVDVRAFFSEYAVLEAVFAYNAAGKPTGECIVRFSGGEASHAKREKHLCYLGHRFVECWLATEEEMQDARGDPGSKRMAGRPCDGHAAHGVAGSCDCLRVRGVPWTATEEDVCGFFRGFTVRRVLLVFNTLGKLTGECYVQLSDHEEVLRALRELDGQYLGRRFVECWPAAEGEMLAEQQRSLRQGRALQRSLALRMRGLPFSAREQDIYDFLARHNVQGVPGTSCIEVGADGRPTGWAYVRLGSEQDMQRCLLLHRKARMGGRYMEMARATEQEMLSATGAAAAKAARPRHGLCSNIETRGGVVMLRGLPFAACEVDIVRFLDGAQIAPHGIHLVLDAAGHRSGECLVELADAAAVARALAHDRSRLGGRYVEVLQSSRDALGPRARGGQRARRQRRRGHLVKLRGLPFSATGLDIARNLFADLQILPRGVHMVLEDNGRPHGQAYVELASQEDVEKALQRHGCEFTSRHAPQAAHTGRYVEVFSCSFADMMRVGSLVHEEEVAIQRKTAWEPLGLVVGGLLLLGVEDHTAAHRRGCEQYAGRTITHVDGVAATSAEALSNMLQTPSASIVLRLALPRSDRDSAVEEDCDIETAHPWQASLPPEVAALAGAPVHRGLQQRAAAALVGPALRHFGDFGGVPLEADAVRYTRDMRVLLVGEGNFAYAAALCERLGAGCGVVATGYEAAAAARRLPGAAASLERLEGLGVAVRHSMDATQLHLPDWGGSGPFDCIRWNHPHSGAYPSGKSNVSHNRCLLERFLQSAEPVLAPGGVVHVVSSQHSLKQWRIEDLGGDLMCCSVERHRNPFPAYEPQRSRGGALPDHEVTVKIYSFQRVREINRRMPEAEPGSPGDVPVQSEAERPAGPMAEAEPMEPTETAELEVGSPLEDVSPGVEAVPVDAGRSVLTGSAPSQLVALPQGPACLHVPLRVPRLLALFSPAAVATICALLAPRAVLEAQAHGDISPGRGELPLARGRVRCLLNFGLRHSLTVR